MGKIPVFPKHYLTITILTVSLILFTLPTFSTSTSSENYASCSHPYSCGSIQIGYPFHGKGRPDICGFPDFHLPCIHNQTIMDNSVKVVSIDNSSHIITVSTLDYFDFCNPADRVTPDYQNKLLHFPGAFRFTAAVVNITVFYACDHKSVLQQYDPTFMCPSANRSSALYFSRLPQEEVKSCRNLSVPVMKKVLDELLKKKNESEMIQEVELEYVVPNATACLGCTKSGGACGSETRSGVVEFMCYCPNGYCQHPFQCHKSGSKTIMIVVLVVATISALGILVLVAKLLVFLHSRKIHSLSKFTFSWTRGTEKDNQNVEAFLKSYGSFAPKRFTYKDIKKMTNSFKDRLGEGGYGHVYKGKLSDGRFVAVKVLKSLKGNNGQNFINEVVSISRTNHVNVVTLLGFCIEGNKQALVYEFLPNGSLEKFIHGSSNGNRPLSSETLFNIVVGIAKGLDYLHGGCNTRILHLDIKPHNILLDKNFCPKISDFGLARLFPKEQTHLSTIEARGTIGYIAPEVLSRSFGGVSHKSDVYSFGMMVIDMVYGKMSNNASSQVQCSGDVTFTQWIHKQLEAEEKIGVEGIGDGEEEKKLRKKMILVSLWCIQTYPVNRPSMNEVVEMLEGSLESLEMPPNEDICWPSLPATDSSGI